MIPGFERNLLSDAFLGRIQLSNIYQDHVSLSIYGIIFPNKKALIHQSILQKDFIEFHKFIDRALPFGKSQVLKEFMEWGSFVLFIIEFIKNLWITKYRSIDFGILDLFY